MIERLTKTLILVPLLFCASTAWADEHTDQQVLQEVYDESVECLSAAAVISEMSKNADQKPAIRQIAQDMDRLTKMHYYLYRYIGNKLGKTDAQTKADFLQRAGTLLDQAYASREGTEKVLTMAGDCIAAFPKPVPAE